MILGSYVWIIGQIHINSMEWGRCKQDTRLTFVETQGVTPHACTVAFDNGNTFSSLPEEKITKVAVERLSSDSEPVE